MKLSGLFDVLSGTKVSAVANVVTIIGVSVVTFGVFLSNLMPWYVHNQLEKEVARLKFDTNRDYVEFIMGKPNVSKEISYDSYSGTEKNVETGHFEMYYRDSNIIICYFDKSDSLFGYVVTSGSKYFNPEIPHTSGKKLLKSGFEQIQPINTKTVYNQPDLKAYSFFTRTDSTYIEKYYAEIFDLNEYGLIGVAATNLPDTDSGRYRELFDYLSDLSYCQEGIDDEFRNVYDKGFSDTTFYCDDGKIIEEITEKGYFLKTRGERPNSYFAFDTSGETDAYQFVKEQLLKHYFVDEFLVYKNGGK